MSDYSALKATINANIKANNNHEITGAITNSVLIAMVNSLGAGYQFMGVATPTNPGSAQTPDYKCFYLATTPGTYTNLGGLVVAEGEVAILKYDTAWTKEVTGIATAAQVSQLGQIVGLLENPYPYKDNTWLDVNGGEHTNNQYLITDYIQVEDGDVIYWYYGTMDDSRALILYNSNKEVIGYYRAIASQRYRTFTLSLDNTTYIRATICKNAGIDAVVKVNNAIAWKVIDYNLHINNIENNINNIENNINNIENNINNITPLIGSNHLTYLYEDKWLDSSGGEHNSDVYITTDYISVTNNDKVVWQHGQMTDDSRCMVLYDAGKNVLDIYRCSTSDVKTEKTISNSSAAYIRATIKKDYAILAGITVNGTTRWVVQPHELLLDSIRKETEHQNGNYKSLVDVVGLSSNPYKFTNGYYLDVNMQPHANADWLYTDYIPVTNGDTILWQYLVNADDQKTLVLYNSSKEAIDYYRASYQNQREITISNENVAYIRASLPNNNQDVKVTVNSSVAWKVFISHESRLNQDEEKIKAIDDTLILNVGTYNVGKFEGTGLITPSDEGSLAYRKVIGGLNCNIIGTQEDYLYYSSMSSGENVRDVIYPMYKNYYREATGETNIKGFCSDYQLKNVEKVYYTGNYTFAHPWFLVGILSLKGKEILLVSFHFDWHDKYNRAAQIEQVISYCSAHTNVILMGDVNVDNYIGGHLVDPDNPFTIEEDFGKFSEAGYELANGGNFGYFGTCLSENDGGQWIPFDGVFVKGGHIRNSWVVTESYMNDHKPICATIVF